MAIWKADSHGLTIACGRPYAELKKLNFSTISPSSGQRMGCSGRLTTTTSDPITSAVTTTSNSIHYFGYNCTYLHYTVFTVCPATWVVKHIVETAFLVCSYISSDGLSKAFCLGNDTLESCLDLLTSFLQQGFQLNSVHLFQQGHKTELPVAAFDITPIGRQLQLLRNQWKAILD